MELDLVVHDVAAGGDGIARAPDGRIVFVRDAIPGDRVEARVERDRKKMIHAVTTTVVEPSPDRVDPPCRFVAAGCGGCGWQHVSPDGQRRAKIRLLEESLRRLGREPVDDDGRPRVPVLDGPPLPTSGFRTSLRVRVTSEGPAFRARASHEDVVVDDCLVAHPSLTALFAPGVLGRGPAEVALRVGGATGERLVHVVDGALVDADLPADVAVALAAGDGAAFRDEVAGVRFRISAASFFQTRTDGAAALVDGVAAALGAAPTGRVADLYGGVGLFAATIARDAQTVVVESSPSSVADARHNVPGAEVIEAPVEQWTPRPVDVVIADPPRAGLGAAAVDVVAATQANRLVLVSCDAASLGRDTALLREVGFDRASSTAIDLFPHTPHVEVVSRFDRR